MDNAQNIIFVLIYRRHKLLDLINAFFFPSTKYVAVLSSYGLHFSLRDTEISLELIVIIRYRF